VEVVLRTNLPRQKVIAALRSLPQRATKRLGPAQQILVRMGQTALGYIKEAFVVKSRGGTDEAGEAWKPLKPETIAYKRRHPLALRKGGFSAKARLPGAKKRAAFSPSFQLSKAENKRWWEVYKGALRRYKGDKAHAAAVAWVVLKSEGARTLLMVYGGLHVEILRDTGLLLASLTPGAVRPTGRPIPVKHQVFRLAPGEVIIGANRKGAHGHHHGVPARNLPQRRLWPPVGNWPTRWWQGITEQCRLGLIELAQDIIKGVS
jgi:hypothetical protein